MSKNEVPAVSQPNYHRTLGNVGSADIEVGRIVARSGAYPGCELATSPAQSLVGVSVEKMTVDGPVRSVQVDGVAPVLAGAAFLRGAHLTADSQGRAVEATDGDEVIGTAETASTGANEWVSVELGKANLGAGGPVMLEVTVGHAALDAAATTQTVNIGAALPTGARILQVESELTEAFAGPSVSAATASLGVASALTSLINARNVFTGQPLVNALGAGTRPGGTYSAAQLQAQFTTTGANVAALNAGSITFRVHYVVR